MSRDYPVCKWCEHSSREADSLRDCKRDGLFCTLNPEWEAVEDDHYCSHFSRTQNKEAVDYYQREETWEASRKSHLKIQELNKQVKRLKERLKNQKEKP